MAVRYDPKLRAEISRVVKNYQAKRSRVLAKGGEIIPEPAYVSTFLTDYTSRRELLRDLKKLERFSVRGVEEVITLESGVQKTLYEIKELKRLSAVAKRNITRELNQAPDLSTLQPLNRGYYENLMVRRDYLRKPIISLSKRQFATYERISHGEGDLYKKRKTFYKNVFDMVDYIGYSVDKSIVDRLKKSLGRLSMLQLMNLMGTDPYLNSIINYYEVLESGGKIPNLDNILLDLANYADTL